MKAATVHDIKTSLETLSHPQLQALCLRLVKFKKENKELATYLLFDADDVNRYIAEVIDDMETGFGAINNSSPYYAKKSVRKILREANKHIRYIGTKTAEVELLMAWCRLLNESGIRFGNSPIMLKLYSGQLKKLRKTIDDLHEDLQYDYNRQLEKITSPK